MFQPKGAIKSHHPEAPARCSVEPKRKERRRNASMLLTDVGVNLLVITAGIFLLSFSKWYVASDAANSSIGLGVFLCHFDRNTIWHRRDAAGPIKLDMPCPNILLGFLRGISRVPSRLRRNATPSSQRQYEKV